MVFLRVLNLFIRELENGKDVFYLINWKAQPNSFDGKTQQGKPTNMLSLDGCGTVHIFSRMVLSVLKYQDTTPSAELLKYAVIELEMP